MEIRYMKLQNRNKFILHHSSQGISFPCYAQALPFLTRSSNSV